MRTDPPAAASLGPNPGPPRPRVILLAGPSGSGKSTLVRGSGIPMVFLDDFYKSGDDPTLPMHPQLGIPDWDHPDSWNRQAALAALDALCREGRAEMPGYDISVNGPTGTRTVEVGDGPFVAEGVFAPELVEELHRRGQLLDAIVVRRDRWKNLVRRTVRDLREHRKPPVMILRRGVNLYRAEAAVVGHAMGAGCRPLNAREVRAALTTCQAAHADPRPLTRGSGSPGPSTSNPA